MISADYCYYKTASKASDLVIYNLVSSATFLSKMDSKEPELKDGIFYTGDKGEFRRNYLKKTC